MSEKRKGKTQGKADGPAKQARSAPEPPSQPAMRAELQADDVAGALADAFQSGKELDQYGCKIGADPFTHFTISDFVQPEFLDRLQEDLSKHEFLEKNNDLYTFSQTVDLKASEALHVAAFRDFLYNTCLPWMERISGIPLKSQPNMFCAKYKQGDTLLCHDDELEGRRIAYILYLTPEDWTSEDGGALDLYGVDANGYPDEVRKSLVPRRGTLAMFPTTMVSFHRVAEVLAASKVRMSVSGWFYGEPIVRHSLPPPAPLAWIAPTPMGAENDGNEEESTLATWCHWIREDYLEVESFQGINKQMEEESQVLLPNFLRDDRMEDIARELAEYTKWKHVGPANHNHFGIMTGFEDEAALALLPPTTAAFVRFLKSAKFVRFLRQLTELPFIGLAGSVRKFGHGDYTLLHDGDEILAESTLDVNFFCTRANFTTSTGGFICYMAEDEDEELLTVEPKHNVLTLVYREQGTNRFVKYINSTAEGPFFDFCATFREDPGVEFEGEYEDDEEGEGGQEEEGGEGEGEDSGEGEGEGDGGEEREEDE